jgi:hypothetical protein
MWMLVDAYAARYYPNLHLDEEGLTNLLDGLSLPNQRINGYRVDRSYQRQQWAYRDRPKYGVRDYYEAKKSNNERKHQHHPLFNG